MVVVVQPQHNATGATETQAAAAVVRQWAVFVFPSRAKLECVLRCFDARLSLSLSLGSSTLIALDRREAKAKTTATSVG